MCDFDAYEDSKNMNTYSFINLTLKIGDFLDKAIYKEDINGKDSEKY